MDPVDVKVERAAVGSDLLTVAAPAVDEPVRAGWEPFILTHLPKISPASRTGNGEYGMR